MKKSAKTKAGNVRMKEGRYEIKRVLRSSFICIRIKSYLLHIFYNITEENIVCATFLVFSSNTIFLQILSESPYCVNFWKMPLNKFISFKVIKDRCWLELFSNLLWKVWKYIQYSQMTFEKCATFILK